MAQQTINGTDTINAGRTKINDNFTELYAGGASDISVVGTITALKALPSPADGQAAEVLGYDAAADGGADVKRYDASSSATDDGGTVHRPSVGPGSTGNGRWISVQPMHMDARKFGVIPGLSATTMTSRLNNALAVAKAKGAGYLHLIAGAYVCNGQITVDDVVVRGVSSSDTRIECNTSLGTDVDFMILKQTSNRRNRAGLRDTYVVGPGARSLGVKTANCNGIKVEDDMAFVDVSVSNFDKGFNVDQNAARLNGHVRWQRCLVSDNYYGVYWPTTGLAGGDMHFLDCDINGNTFAGWAFHGNGLAPGFSWKGGHCGYQPFGIYQEASTNNAAFCSGIYLEGVTFENMGNCAIFTENWNAAHPDCGVAENLIMNNTNFTRWTFYRIGTKYFATPIKLGPARGVFDLRAGGGPFTGDATTDPAIYFRTTQGQVNIDFTSAIASQATAVEIGDTNYERVHYIPRTIPQFDTQINSGATSTTINLHYLGPVASLKPQVIPTTNGGLGAFQLYVDEATVTSNASTDTTSFQVKVVGGTPTSALKFRVAF